MLPQRRVLCAYSDAGMKKKLRIPWLLQQ